MRRVLLCYSIGAAVPSRHTVVLAALPSFGGVALARSVLRRPATALVLPLPPRSAPAAVPRRYPDTAHLQTRRLGGLAEQEDLAELEAGRRWLWEALAVSRSLGAENSWVAPRTSCARGERGRIVLSQCLSEAAD